MNDFKHRIANLTPKQLVLLADQLNTKLEKANLTATEPLAVIGMGCRFPGGAENPALFWDLLASGKEGIMEVPPDRWDIDAFYDPDPDKPGKMSTRWGGFLETIDSFDADFFGISPREAKTMDPQQRLLLEVTWETLENANLNPHGLAGSSTGVFVGICNSDYFHMMLRGGSSEIDAYLATGSAHSIASGRISYILGLQGPSISIDTACSSSLVAVHLACQSLRSGECRLALAGGVNLILSPETTITLTKAHLMSATGRCKTFDKDADGFVRGEGCGMIALKRLADAQADRDSIIALVLGSASNQDGRSSGITAPNGPSQASVIRKALRNSGLKPDDVDYIEAHGTGTTLGDPIEMGALAEVFGPSSERYEPLLVGSIKTNIGHGESSAGIAGLMKLILAVNKAEVPPHLQFQAPNPAIDWDSLSVRIPVKSEPWPRSGGRRIGGVSSFGFSGTNAHVIIGDAPVSPVPAQNRSTGRHLIALSAHNNVALCDLVHRYADFLKSSPETSVEEFSWILAKARAHHACRAAFTARSPIEILKNLEAVRGDDTKEGIHRGTAGKHAMQPVFLFTGQGGQYPGMGLRLYETQPTFRRALDSCDQILHPIIGKTIKELIDPIPGASSQLDRTRYTQPVLFALEYALAHLWREWGIEPAAVMGHSVGEYVAACVAGLFSLEDGLRLIARRGELMQQLPENGAMAAVAAPVEDVQTFMDDISGTVSVAAVNSPSQTVISGEQKPLAGLLEAMENNGIRHQKLRVSHAFHSQLMDPMLDALASEAASVEFSKPQIPIVSNLTGTFVEDDTMCHPAYWCEHTRRTVQFASGIQALFQSGNRHFLEIGPHPVLTALGRHCLADKPVKWYAGMRKEKDDEQEILEALGALYANGAEVRWNQVVPPTKDAMRTRLPAYPFQRKRHWLEIPPQQSIPAAEPVSTGDPNKPVHRLLGRPLSSPALKQVVFESQVSAARPAFLNHHRVFGHCIMPTPAYLEMAMAVSLENGGDTQSAGWDISDIRIEEALILPEGEAVTVQTVYAPADDGTGECQFFGRTASGREAEWRRHATCRIQRPTSPPLSGAEAIEVQNLRMRCPHELPVDEFYHRLQDAGLVFGTAFRGVERIWQGDHRALGQMAIPEELVRDAKTFFFHPAHLDACFHILGAAMGHHLAGSAYLLIGMDRFRLYRTPPSRFWNSTRLRPTGRRSESFNGDILLFDKDGKVIGEFTNLLLKRADHNAMMALTKKRETRNQLYALRWHEKAFPEMKAASESDLESQKENGVAWLSECLKAHARSFGADVYTSLLPRLDRYCAAAIIGMIHEAGISLTPGEKQTRDDFERQLGVIPRHRRLLNRMIDILVEENVLRLEPDAFLTAISPCTTKPVESAEDLVRLHPACEAEIRLTQRCAGRLLEVLQGQCNPMDLLFPDGEINSLESIYRDSPYARTFNSTLGDALINEMTRKEKLGRPVRILEIGAGTGGTTAHLLPLLAGKRYSYLFTDISPLFLARARANFGTNPSVEFEILDIEKNPTEHGFTGRQFDIVIAANVLHATRNLKETIANVQKLMAPGAMLILLEGTASQRWVDLTFGMTEGWWCFQDEDLRPDYALIDREKWEHLLTDAGLAPSSVALDASTHNDVTLPQTLVLARKSAKDASIRKGPHAWFVIDDGGRFCKTLASGIKAAGDEILQVIGGSGQPTTRIKDVKIRLEQALAASGDRALSIVYIQEVPESKTTDDNPADTLKPVLHFVKEIIAASSSQSERLKLWVVTRGAQPALLTDPVQSPSLAGIWGLMRVFALEQPRLFGGIVDLDPESSDEVAANDLLTQIKSNDDEDQIIIRSGRRYVPRIERLENPNTIAAPVRLKKQATYLVTGGLGGLGLKIAQWMSRQGAGKLVLVSRKVLPPRDDWHEMPADAPMAYWIRALQEIEKGGAVVEIVSADVGNRDAMLALFTKLRKDPVYPLKGILHAAVQMSGASFETLSEQNLDEMMQGKAKGALLLDEFSHGMPLDFFTMFSSTTSLWGAAGLAHYGAANQILDTLAYRRRSKNLPGVSINWGTWEEMRVAGAKDKEAFLQAGLIPIPVDRALSLLGSYLGHKKPQICIANVNWPRLLDIYEARRKRPLFEKVRPPAGPQVAENMAGAHRDYCKLKHSLESTSKDQWAATISTHLKSLVGQILQIESTHHVYAGKGLFDMGMDSLMAVELKGRIEKDTGLSLPSTLTFNYPTIDELTGFLMKQMSPREHHPLPEAKRDIAPAPAAAAAPSADTNADASDSLTEEQLSQLLIEKLKELK